MGNAVNIAGVWLKNPILTASGTYNYRESSGYYDPAALGAVTTKSVSPTPWPGNDAPVIAETHGGMLNAIGLANRGLEAYLAPGGELAMLKAAGATVCANVVGRTAEDYTKVCEGLADSAVDLLELNISCPNVKCGGMSFGTDPAVAADLVRKCKIAAGAKPLLVKLTPNVTDITEIARAALDAGADGLTLINTLKGMRIDLKTGRPVLSTGAGGLSGPAIHPVAVRMVWETRQAVGDKVPIIGMGGVMTGADAYELILAGANAVAVGTAALIDPRAPVRILGELAEYLRFDTGKSSEKYSENM
ncbi:MAG: dihydroorotate dehydrogenase [Clostridiales Family XIII bacterium]|jgi:dihydroorotate dehydrogenase (NAD+) catalytic subunit|nr:dihydroorotate dehydrogenase [Clostridiales Family XIII bacterium]